MSNREIDALIYHNIMGMARPPEGWPLIKPVPHYSTDPVASKQLQCKVNELKWYWRIDRTPEGVVHVSIWGQFGAVVTMRGTVVETVFALAALKAHGVELEGKNA